MSFSGVFQRGACHHTETILPGLVPGSSGSGILSIAIYTFVIIAFSEEFSKYIFLRYYSYRKRSFNEPFDGIIYMVMVGMGFATIENLMYVLVQTLLQNQWATAGMRAITAVPAHASFIVMGYYAGLAKFSKDKEKQLLMQGILYATILHGFTISSCSRISVRVLPSVHWFHLSLESDSL